MDDNHSKAYYIVRKVVRIAVLVALAAIILTLFELMASQAMVIGGNLGIVVALVVDLVVATVFGWPIYRIVSHLYTDK